MEDRQIPSTTMPWRARDITAFVADWYRELDEHVPLEDVQRMLLDEGLEYTVPEGTLRGHREFGYWYTGGNGYPGVINVFFDEVHTVLGVEVTSWGERARLAVVVNWQARRWSPPAPRSEWIGFDAFQTWDVVASPETGRPLIARYLVDELRPMPGSPRLT